MPINMLGNRIINERNLSNLVSYNDKEKATALSLWERFIDLFRVNKKSDVVNILHSLINKNSAQGDNTNGSMFYHFEQLRHLADPVHHSLFEINVGQTSENESHYVFLIAGNEISNLTTSTGWNTLSRIRYNELSLVENYGEIIKNYVKLNEQGFKIEYPDTAIKDSYGADEMLDYSCYFLKNNADIREMILDHGLVNCDILDNISADMMGRNELNDDIKGRNMYSLQTMMGTLRVLEKFDGDYI